MMKFAVLFALVAVAVATPVPSFPALSPTGRIVGGVATSIEAVPYQVSLQVLSSHICGGNIISDTWILTAAHCMIYSSVWYNVRAGTAFSNNGGSLHALTSVVNHADYYINSDGIPFHDIAVLRLRTPLTLDATRAVISLFVANEEAVAGSPATITGWGALSSGGSAPIVLQTITIPIVSKADCSAAYSFWGGIPDGQICAGLPEGGQGACQGDSGGPLAIYGRLAGIVSWGAGCAHGDFPTAYTEVAAYRGWITENSGV